LTGQKRVDRSARVDTVESPEALLAAFDEQARIESPSPPAGVWYEHDGPLLRVVGEERGFIGAPRDTGARGAELDRFRPGTQFAGLWGGGTLSEWRGRGIYRALVSRRAQLAAARDFRYLQVDASSNSAPILRRLGFQPIATTTPYVWTPVS
jgi:GNAT superfamily N-acetyltransferase